MIYCLSSIVTICLPCTISKILSIICQNLKWSGDHDHAHWKDYLSIQRLILYVANKSTTPEVSSLSRSRDSSGVLKLKVGHVKWARLFRCQFVLHWLGLAMIIDQPAHQVWSLYVHPLRRYEWQHKMWKLICFGGTLSHRQCHHSIECLRLPTRL